MSLAEIGLWLTKNRLENRLKSEPIFWEGDATKHSSEEKKGFSVKRGEAIQWIRGLVRISTGKAIQWRGSGHSLNCRTLKIEKLLSSFPARKSALIKVWDIPPTPDRGPNPHFPKKRVSGSKKTHFPSFWKREFSVKKSHKSLFFLQGNALKIVDFSAENSPKPSFPGNRDAGPCLGWGVSQLKVAKLSKKFAHTKGVVRQHASKKGS